jgi:hypothetical protein
LIPHTHQFLLFTAGPYYHVAPEHIPTAPEGTAFSHTAAEQAIASANLRVVSTFPIAFSDPFAGGREALRYKALGASRDFVLENYMTQFRRSMYVMRRHDESRSTHTQSNRPQRRTDGVQPALSATHLEDKIAAGVYVIIRSSDALHRVFDHGAVATALAKATAKTDSQVRVNASHYSMHRWPIVDELLLYFRRSSYAISCCCCFTDPIRKQCNDTD